MHRREFLAAGISGILSYTCTCNRRAMASPSARGCRMAQVSGEMGAVSREVSPIITSLAQPCQTYLGVRAAVRSYDDSASPNAKASAESAPFAPDGTVLFGRTFMSELNKEQTAIIVAHETAHILQFKNGISPDGPWQMEPHADFMAGWVCGRNKEKSSHMLFSRLATNLDQQANLAFSIGDTDFNDRDHHGEPQFRAAMVRAGFDAAHLSVQEAFEKGKKMAGLA
jgi:hypothetical protein